MPQPSSPSGLSLDPKTSSSANSLPSVLIPLFLLPLLLSAAAGCGGGSAAPQSLQPPPSPDFSLTLSSDSLSVPQGGTSSAINISAAPQDGFTGTVQITLTGLPTGVISNPASPFTVTSGASTSLLFGATPSAATGTFSINATATSAALSHSANLALTVQSSLGYTSQVYANPALKGEPAQYKFLLYDQKRQFIYLSAAAQIDVFDLQAAIFKPTGLTLYCPSYRSPGPCPDDDVRGMVLTPDGSHLIAADFGSQNIYLFDPDTPNTPAIATSVAASGYNPARVAATNLQTVFVAFSAEATPSAMCSSCVAQLDLSATPPTIQPLLQPELATLTASPLLQADPAGDRVILSFATAPGGPLGIWDPARQVFNLSATNEIATDLAVAADGTSCATAVGPAIEVHGVDSNLQSTLLSTFTVPPSTQVPNRFAVPGLVMHPTGALLYQPFLTGPPPPPPSPGAPPVTGLLGGIDILDAHTGQLRFRVLLPEPFAALSTDIDGLHAGFIALDETGQRIFALTTFGLTVVQLTHVPLGIGTLSPATGPASGGTTLTIRGSGFQTGSTATLGGKTATVTFKDMNTLTIVTPSMTSGPQQITVTNPDSETSTLSAAFTAS